MTALLDPLLTREELAEYLRVSPRQVDVLRRSLPEPIKVGRLPRWRASDIAEWVRQQSDSTSETSAAA
jgi:predicted DNA-binding transcriptional regulator AlpA